MAQFCAYRDKEEAHTEEHWDIVIRELSDKELQLGRNAFAEGIIVKGWKEAQARHFGLTEAKIDPGQWTNKMIKWMWMICSDLWESRNA